MDSSDFKFSLQMNHVEQVRVMISSRCKDPFPVGGRLLSDIRPLIKTELENMQLEGHQLFEVWISEHTPAQDLSKSSAEVCISEATRADIVLVFYNGHAGDVYDGDNIGICHKELAAAWESAPAKVRLILLRGQQPADPHHLLFQEYVKRIGMFRGSADDEASLLAATKECLVATAFELMRAGARDSRKGNLSLGEALDWKRLSIPERRARMKNTLHHGLSNWKNARAVGDSIISPVAETPILLVPHAVPGSLGDKELLGALDRPALKDYQFSETLANEASEGPVHVIACQKAVTESQAKTLLGFPDATIVQTRFGIYVSDQIQSIQYILLENCQDSTMLYQQLDRILEWFRQSYEDLNLALRAESRRKLVTQMAENISRERSKLGQERLDNLVTLASGPTVPAIPESV